MRWSSTVLLLVFLLSQSVGVPGCKSGCPPPTQSYTCNLNNAKPKPGACSAICGDSGLPVELPNFPPVCATDETDARAQFETRAASSLFWDVTIGICYLSKDAARVGPGPVPQTLPPSCEETPSDDACVVCAKAFCCGEYQACAGDALCLCWVDCKYAGNTDDACAQPAKCGPLDGVSAAAATCLNASCPTECGTMSTMVGACMCGSSTSSSSSGGGGPTCTPGSFGSGEPCFSDGDCASCICDAQTMTCG